MLVSDAVDGLSVMLVSVTVPAVTVTVVEVKTVPDVAVTIV